MSQPILLVTLHPNPSSFCAALADAYAQGASLSGHTVLRHDLWQMAFDPDFGPHGFAGAPALEPDLLRLREALLLAKHVVLVAPMWWGGLPARAKGLIDRLLLPGFAFDPRERQLGLPKPLLQGRSARLILTSDTPGWAFRFFYAQALRHQIARQVLGFVGIKPMGFTHLSVVQDAPALQRQAWLHQVRALGAKAV
jgi:NAD(P)H dehydrogenase (quinone)